MPELPEVETLRRDLQGSVVGKSIVSIMLEDASVVRVPTAESFVSSLEGASIEDVERRGKFLLIVLDTGKLWAVHLSLEGRLLLEPADAPAPEGTRLEALLDDGSALRLWDRFTYPSTAVADRETIERVYKLATFGPEPTAADFTVKTLRERFKRRRGMLKPLLLDQHVLAGVGNIYADEALWRARLHPMRGAASLTAAEWASLRDGLVGSMSDAIEHRGTSAPGGLYRDLHGFKGQHQSHLAVFRRAGKKCPRCGSVIERTEVGNRSTFLCPKCQPAPAAVAENDDAMEKIPSMGDRKRRAKKTAA